MLPIEQNRKDVLECILPIPDAPGLRELEEYTLI